MYIIVYIYLNALLVVFTSHLLCHICMFVVLTAVETGQSRPLSTSVTSQGIPQLMDTSPTVCT